MPRSTTSSVDTPNTPGDTTGDTAGDTAGAEFGLSRESRNIFIALMLGMLVASISQTIVGPALPQIVAQLGGMDHYSWVATAAMLVSAISVPIVGKLSDIYGRRPFYLAGLIVFMLGSVLAGVSNSFWMLVAARAVQGFGMGTLMPLSQTIIGDIIPPRQRGKYQGLMGAVFGVSSIAGPLIGGLVTDHLGWRWLFFISLPVGVIAYIGIHRYLHLPHESRDVVIDKAGILVLSVALILVLTATSIGGTSFAWGSWQILTMFGIGLVLLAVFVSIERRAEEPVIPLRLFRSPIFTWSNVASFMVAVMMFGAMIYLPVYAQGVLGVSATNSGLIIMPMSVGMIGMSIVSGLLITRTGKYKVQTLLGIIIMAIGFWMLLRMDYSATAGQLTLAMVVFGVGLGFALQVYTLIVQNSSQRRDLGVATASTQFFRNVGSTVGIAVFGTIMSSTMNDNIVTHLPEAARAAMASTGVSVSAGDVMDPSKMQQLPPAIAEAVRLGLADSLHTLFAWGMVPAAIAFVATLFIKEVPLRDTVQSAEHAGREMLDTMGQASSSDVVIPLGRERDASRTHERILGLRLTMLAQAAGNPDRPLLARAVTQLGDGDFHRGMALLERASRMLTTDDQGVASDLEKYAVEVAARGQKPGGILDEELKRELVTALADTSSPEVVLTTIEPTVAQRHEALDMASVRAVADDLSAAHLVDLKQSGDRALVGLERQTAHS